MQKKLLWHWIFRHFREKFPPLFQAGNVFHFFTPKYSKILFFIIELNSFSPLQIRNCKFDSYFRFKYLTTQFFLNFTQQIPIERFFIPLPRPAVVHWRKMKIHLWYFVIPEIIFFCVCIGSPRWEKLAAELYRRIVEWKSSSYFFFVLVWCVRMPRIHISLI